MRSSFSLLVMALAAGPAWAQSPSWLREFGGFGDDWASALLSPEPGRVIMAGGTGNALFAPPQGLEDAFVAWFDSAGNLLGGAQFGSTLVDYAVDLAPADDGGMFVAGESNGSLAAPNAGSWDAWLARRDAAGGPVWARQLGTPEWESAYALCPDGAGGVFWAGTTQGDLGGPSAGGIDAWIARYDGAGTQLWLQQFGSANTDIPAVLVPDGAGGFFVAGTSTGALFGAASGLGDAWIARYDGAGVRLWAHQFGTPANDTGRAMCPDGAGGVLLAGFTVGNLAGPNAGDSDVWIARYDGAGTRLAFRQFGGASSDSPEAICPDGYGGAFVAGNTGGPLGGPHAGQADIWVARLRPDLSVEWIHQAGSPAFDGPGAIAAAGPGRAYVAGMTLGALAPGGGGNADAWLALYETCYPDCTGDGKLNLDDLGCFQTRFALGEPYSDCNGDGALNLADFGCFQTKFALGCP